MLPAKALKRPVKIAARPAEVTITAATKAGRFAMEATGSGWEVEPKIEGDRKTAICRRDDEIVEVNWTKEVAEGPIGHYTFNGATSSIKNAAAALRIIRGKPGEFAPSPRAKAIKSQEPRKPRVLKKTPMPIDLYSATDTEVIAAVRGRKIFWTNSSNPGQPESGYVPNEIETRMDRNKQIIEKQCEVTITLSKAEDTLGERILNFCDPQVGFRALFVGALVKIGG